MLYCEDVELMLQDYFDGYLLPSQREILERHIRGCQRCRDLAAGIGKLDRRIDALTDVEVPAGLSRAILEALPGRAYGPSPLRRALVWGTVPALAAFLAVVALLAGGRSELRQRFAEREVEVVYAAPHAGSVSVVGDFNAWDPQRTRMVRAGREGSWTARLRLPPGVHQYCFVIDGMTWVPDPGAKSFLADGFGGENSVIVVDG